MTRRTYLLICLCLLAVGKTAQTQGDPSGGGRPHGGPPQMSAADKDKFRQRIGLSVQQQAQLDAVFEEMRNQRKPLSDKLRELHRQRHDLLTSYTLDRGKEKSLRAEITSLYGRLLQLHTESEEKIRRIMTREQYERLQQLMREKMSQDGSRPRRGGDWNGRDNSKIQ